MNGRYLIKQKNVQKKKEQQQRIWVVPENDESQYEEYTAVVLEKRLKNTLVM
jgi:hypothetical protein